MLSTPPRLTATAGNLTPAINRWAISRLAISNDSTAPHPRACSSAVHARDDLETRIVDRLDRVPALQFPGNVEGGLLGVVHSHLERLDTPHRQPAVLRTKDPSQGVLEKLQLFGQLGAAGHCQAGDDVAVTGQELGGAVDDNVSAELEGGL